VTYLFTQRSRDLKETWHKYLSREWALLGRFSVSRVKGQGQAAMEILGIR